MKILSASRLGWWVVCFLTAVGAAGFRSLAQDPPVEGRFRELTGEVRIESTNAEILAWLGPPGNRGMSQLSVRAEGVGPHAGLMAQAVAATPGRLANGYRLSVQAGTNAATAIAYAVRGIVGLDADRQLYQTGAVRTGPLEAGPDAVMLDLAECGAAVRFRFVDAAGQPLAVSGGQGLVIADGELRVQVFGMEAGSTEAFVLVPADADLDLSFEFQRGSDPYVDRMNRPVVLSARVPCGSVEVVDVVFGSTAALGRISGIVDLVGEFEKTTGPAVSGGIAGRTVVVAHGPAANRRLGGLVGDNVALPASGPVALENLLPSDAVTPAEPWRLQAQMHLRGGRAFEYFVSPAVGEGLNPGIRVLGGETTPLGGIFQMQAGWIAGRVELVGPPETDATKSALRGVQRPDDAGVDAFGNPTGAAAYGITDSHVVASGVDARAPGAHWTAAGGRAAVNFSGDFDPGRSRFAGTYEIAVGGLDGEASVWKRDQFQLSLFTSGEGHPGVNQVLNIQERAAPPLTVVPGGRVAADVRLGFGEVCLRLRTPGRRFHSPAVSQARGEFVGVDFEGRSRDYLVTIEAAYGAPVSAAEASETGLLALALPEGTYRMRPSLRVLNEDGTDSLAELDEIEVVVVARQRVCMEGCLRVRAQVEGCGPNNTARVSGRVDSCGQSVASVTYQVDDGPHVVVCQDCGAAPVLDFEVPLQAGSRMVTITATDAGGAVGSVTAALVTDTTAPVITCPGNLVWTAQSVCGAAGVYGVTATDNCGPVVLSFSPAEGSVLPLGETQVTATAKDGAGNESRCTFVVTVIGAGTDPGALLAYEPFHDASATPGIAMSGLAAGLGWSGGWGPGGFNASVGSADGFRWTAMAPDPGGLPQDGGAVTAAARALDLGGIVRGLLEPLGEDGTTVYVSLVLRPEGVVGAGAFNGFFGMTLNGSMGDDLFLGKPGAGALDRYVVETRGGSGQQATAVPVVSGQAVRLVLRAEFRPGADRFILYVNPAPDLPEPSSGVEKLDLDLGRVERIGWYATGGFTADEIRVGRTFTEVAATRMPPPELAMVSPDRVSPLGGTAIVITGEGLDATDEIRVGGLPLESPVWVSSREVSGVVPALAVGEHAVEAWRCGTLVATLPVRVTAGDRPVLSEISPDVSHPPGGGAIVAVGSGFGPSTRLRIAFDATDASLVRDLVVMPGGGLLMGTIPPLPEGVAVGTYDVVAEDPRGDAVLVGSFTYHPTPVAPEDPLWAALTALESESATPMQVSLRSGQVEALGGRFPTTGGTAEARAVNFLESHRALLQMPMVGPLELGLESVVSEELDHVRLVQSIGGVPVFAGEVVVSLQGSEVFAMNGALVSPEALARAGVSLTPTLSALDARMVALRVLGIPAPGFGIPAESRLVVFDPAVLGDQPSEPHLAQHIRFPALDREVFVDAHTGRVLLTRALSQTAGGPLDGLNLEVRDARGLTNLVDEACEALSTTPLVARGLVDGDDDDSFIEPGYVPDALATAVYRFARDAYGFFNSRFAWQGFGNSDWPVLVFAHDRVSDNAFAHGCFIRIGDQLVDYEVVVHEYAHNVISARGNSRLQYMNQSGALNESYSDTMGVAAGRIAGQTEWRFGPGLFSREFIDPTKSGLGTSAQPAHFSAFVTFQPDTNGVVADNGGVHMNSGIPNRAAYLLSEGMVLPNGGATPRFQPGVGLDRMLALKFAAMRFLPGNASFAVARNFEVQYATTLARLPLSGWSARDVAAVRNAWFLVGIGNPDLDGDGIEETSDVDRDFVPDALDNCRLVPNTRQEDADADGVGDVCDNCPTIANNRQLNLDRDAFGDECDDDMDGDGCRNNVDQEPRESIGVVGRTVSLRSSANCEAQEGDFYGPVSFDTDRDGRRDCEDDDDDGDGIPDAADPCPVGALSDFFGRNFLPFPYLPLVGECGVQALCIPRLPPAVLDYGEFDFEGVFIRVRDSRINPNPERDAILEDVRIVNGTLYASPGPGVSLGGLAARVVGRSGTGGRRDAGVAGPVPEDWRRMEVWQRPGAGGAPLLLGILGEFDPASLSVDGLGAGQWLALTPAIGAAPARLAATWNFGGAEVSLTEDSDQDGLPDGYEIATGLDPRSPADGGRDADGDGLTALEEYRAGTNPASAQSRFGMEGVERVAGGLRVTWSAAPGIRVILERAARIDATAWEPVGSPVLMQGERAERQVPLTEMGEGYFRIRRP